MREQIKWLWDNMDAKYHKRHIMALMISVLTCVMLLVNPALSQRLIDDVIVAQNPDPLLGILMVMLAVKLLREGLRYLMVVTLETDSQNVIFNLRTRLFEKMQYNDMRFFDSHRTGDLMTRMSADLDWCRHFLSFIDYRIIDSSCTFLFATVYLMTVSWKMTLMLIIITPILLMITKLFSSHVRPRFVAMREKLSEMNTAAQENIAGNRVVKAFAREEYEKDRFREKNEAFRQSHLKINKTWLTFFPMIELLANGMMLVNVFVGGLFIINGELTPGELAIFTGLSWAMSNPMRELGNLINDLQRFSTSAAKVMELAYLKPNISDPQFAVDHPKMKGEIEFRDVSFRYDTQEVLKNISFHVLPGQTVAVMGPTGGGKSTLIQLMARFYDVSDGAVLVDGCDVREWKLQQLRGGIGTATQDVFLFSDTVEGNVAFGNQSLTLDEVRDFAKRAAADEFIEHLSEGYDTIVGERGVGLSGGQKQRIALARALAMRPSILVMDDTTSAVDSETEQYIQNELRNLPFPCTKFIIAQRISSMKDADLILVLQDGQITEAGTHQELLRKQGYYWQTYVLQYGLQGEEAAKHGA
ncbi:MAG: ABC transporter ATP-binding protein [Clostridia bacterium]|nr:ABC transporter ATP-binding protein [Clostridia bacterium]MBQ2461225.1 ABC transporter ATP-binding protein [Clostridia bacterium]MBQ9289973.1 ABC transporter ATP-binding protein [Clostridia bacterium]